MWVHLPELSINLAMVLRVIPTAEGKIQVVQADNTTLTIDGPKADAICQCLATLPNGNMDSWLAQRIALVQQVMQQAQQQAAQQPKT
jgi:hypothetical protein